MGISIRFTGEHLGEQIQLNEAGDAYECPSLNLQAPTLTDLYAAMRSAKARQAQGLEPYSSGKGFPRFSSL